MKKNMGSLDKILRTAAAVVLAILIYMKVLTGPLAWITGILAIVFVLTSLFSFCPLYVPFRISTLKVSKKKEG